MQPPEGWATCGVCRGEGGNQADPWGGGQCDVLPFHGAGDGSGIKDGGDDVDEVGWIFADLSPLFDGCGPMRDERGADAPFVDPRFVEPMRGVASGGESRAETEVSLCAAKRSRRVVTIPSDHDLCAGAVIGGEEDQRVVPAIHCAQLGEDTTDLLVHPVDHGCVDGHFGGLEVLLLGRQVLPRKWEFALTGSEGFVSLWETVGWPGPAIGWSERGVGHLEG